MVIYTQSKKGFYEFLDQINKSYELIAPIKTDVVRFEKVKKVEDINLTEQSYTPAKGFFLRQHEVLFNFDGLKTKVVLPKFKPRVFFGLRRCDLNAVHHQDIAFRETKDPYYTNARKNTLLFGYHCNTAPSKYCFCGSMDLIDFYDLMFYEKKDCFLIEIGSKKGEEMIKKHKNFFQPTKKAITKKEKVIPGTNRLKDKDISGLYDNKDWKKGVDICLSCAACTNLCPTCYCFEIYDDVNTKNPKTGTRNRNWSSCQLQSFTRVAGDYVFREKREERFKHRIYHQLDYFKKRNNVNLCVGCGRCIEHCPTRIDFVEIINDMKKK